MIPIIIAESLTKVYTTHKRGSTFGETVKSLFKRERVDVTAVKDVSFQIGEGEIVGLLGPNGAGKSSIIKMLTGVLFPTSGKITAAGFNPFKDRVQYVKQIGALFGQKSQLIFDIPPADSFMMNKAIYEIPTPQYKQTLDNMVTLLNLGDVINKPTRVLSLGERMKCEFVMAMLHNPKIVFLDEPTIGLDIIAKEKIREFVLEMNKAGVTFILTTHDVEDIERLAERAIIINNGTIVFEDTLVALRHHLGEKKAVRVTTKTPSAAEAVNGVAILSTADCEIDMVVDNDIISMNDFMVYVSTLGEIADISIKELGVEEIIKSIYRG